MTNIYACLCGKWVNLCDDEKCVMGNHMTSPRVILLENTQCSPRSNSRASVAYRP